MEQFVRIYWGYVGMLCGNQFLELPYSDNSHACHLKYEGHIFVYSIH